MLAYCQNDHGSLAPAALSHGPYTVEVWAVTRMPNSNGNVEGEHAFKIIPKAPDCPVDVPIEVEATRDGALAFTHGHPLALTQQINFQQVGSTEQDAATLG